MESIYIAGHSGMVGQAIHKKFIKEFPNIKIITKSHKELDLTSQDAVFHFMDSEKPEGVIIAAAKVGGINANETYPADFIYDNLMIQNNIIFSAHKNKVKRLLFLGSSCIYPRNINLPIKEDHLLTGVLEKTNEAYAVAKIAGIKACEAYNKQYGTDFRTVMPTNLYGPNDNYHLQNSHVIPALIRKVFEARKNNSQNIVVWGDGSARREFLHVSDLAEICSLIFNLTKERFINLVEEKTCHINAGSGKDISIKELIDLIIEIADYKGEVFYDKTKPNGTPRKLLNIDKISSIGWKPIYSLKEGLTETFEHYEASRVNN